VTNRTEDATVGKVREAAQIAHPGNGDNLAERHK
jgi:hypothetical protein